MELHRNRRYDRKLSLVGIVYGIVSFAVGAGIALMGGRSGPLLVTLWVSGGFFFLLGIIVLFGSFKSFRIAFDERGLIVHSNGLDFEGSWDTIDGISIEPVVAPGNPPRNLNILVLWLPPRVPMKSQPRFPGAGRKGYHLTDLGDVTETPEQVAQMLQRFAGHKFRSLAHA